MIGKSGKRISTPYGTFETITEASKKLNISWDKVSYRIKSKKYIDSKSIIKINRTFFR